MSSLPKHSAALDSLRGVAVLLVVLHHYVLLYPASSPQKYLFINGYIGVDLFFVLSGFLVAESIQNLQPFSWKTYLTKRALRILPAYYAALIIGSFLNYANVTSEKADNLPLSILYHVFFLQDYFPNNIIGAFWSLGVEIKFYLLAPFIVLSLSRLQNIKIILLILFCIAMIAPLSRFIALFSHHFMLPETILESFQTYRTPFHVCLEPLMMGVMMSFIKVQNNVFQALLPKTVFYIGACSFILIMWLSGNHMLSITPFEVVILPTLVAFTMGVFVLSAVKGGYPSFLQNRVLSWFARISFSLYLTHFIVIKTVISLTLVLKSKINAYDLETNANIIFFVSALVSFAYSCLIAKFFYEKIEAPFLRKKNAL